MKFSYEYINKNIKVYHEAREILPVIVQYEKGEITNSALRSLGLGRFGEFWDFLTTLEKNTFQPVMSDMTWRKLKPLLISKTNINRFQTLLSNKTQNQFKKLLLDGETYDRLLNGRWIRKPGYTKRNRKTWGQRANECVDSLYTCIVPILNYLIQTESEVYDSRTDFFESFVSQARYQPTIIWYTQEVLKFDSVPKREIEITTNLLSNLAKFIDDSRIDFRKLNFDYLNISLTDKLKKLMTVPIGTRLKCIKDHKLSNLSTVAYIKEGNSYEVRSSSINNGYVRVLVINDVGRTEWCDYSHFEDVALHRDDILNSLFN